ncbi:pilus assembly protein FimV [Polaromonas sp. OV174]|uniref:FimV/HubP family polar landmark protein n=1 Tax=Polaromonas sp. OV174 TaxID=1855300 RepID=UPI0008F2F600|nr:FimV/HubP family polar landmark protein [Polaromonas sp. OV174]SFB78222.1 pilus assembly protein FimV [Polaromonas sp. OV174]
MNNRGRWRIGALASAIALLGSVASLEAHALALGRITVQSALGEPLRAEIDIPDITTEEAASLRAGVAPVDSFKAAGLEYTTALTGLEINLQRRADGRAYLRLSSSRPITEPFVDLILQANWASGRISRDYTMLFDPPNLRANSAIAAAPTAPMLSRPVAPIATLPARPQATQPAPAARPAPLAKAPAPKPIQIEKAAAGDKQITVKAGDTASKIAAQNKAASVSLDQMLVALLRSNPEAFIGGNINRIKSGAVLDVPSAEAASAVSPGEASQTIVAQSKDFNAFRRKLAENVPATQVASADRQAGGKVQAKVEDRAPANATPDKLTLSKGAIQGKPAATLEDKIATDKQAKDTASRMAELSKNIDDLNKLSAPPTAASTATAPVAAVSATSVLAAPAAVPSSAPSSSAATPAAEPVPALQAASAAASPASAVAVAAPKPVPSAQPQPESSLIDSVLDNPLLLPGAAGLLALLAGLGLYRYRQRNKNGQVDSSFLESRLQPDSFFGASGGQRIDTSESNVTGSSLAYSSSQLDAAGDVDPVAEADVYLAYGRDLQAEEILKEALHTSPTRVAIHAKLLEIYGKRRDSKAFEGVAVEAFNLTQGFGPEWAYISEIGRDLDPANPMYQTGSAHANNAAPAVKTAVTAPLDQPQTLSVAAAAATAASADIDLDLDLDFSLTDDEPSLHTAPASISAFAPAAPEHAVDTPAAISPNPVFDDLDLNFDLATAELPAASVADPAAAVDLSHPGLDFPTDELSFTSEPFAAPEPVKPAPAQTHADNGMLEFDLSALSLDLGPSTEAPAHALTASPEDPLEIKFLLAEEFRSLGDPDGAKSLADEVLSKASGPLKVKVQAFLNALS